MVYLQYNLYRKYGVPLHNFFFRKLDQRYNPPEKNKDDIYDSMQVILMLRW